MFLSASILLLSLSSCTKAKIATPDPKVLSVKSGNSIQEVIDAAIPGDMVLIEAGTYKGDIVVTTENITIRGEDRNNVIIDGKFKQDNGIIVAANGVRIENLTVQAFKTNGILVQGGYDSGETSEKSSSDIVEKYVVQYVNALNNGLYGIYAFSATDGNISNTYTKANADAGIYIGQCKPCRALVYKNEAELNGIGFQGANASEELYVFSNIFSNNRTGIHLLSETKETKSPQESVVVSANLVSENNANGAPTTTPDLYGFGIIVAGGNDNLIEKNRADKNVQVGIILVENGEFLPNGNSFKENEARENGVPFGFDLAYIITGRPDVMSLGNCFEGNSYSSSSIDEIESVLTCEGAAPGPFKSQPLKDFQVPAAPDYKSIAIETQTKENMSDPLDKLPGQLKSITKPDLSTLVTPNAQ